jgi:hypothetical protein
MPAGLPALAKGFRMTRLPHRSGNGRLLLAIVALGCLAAPVVADPLDQGTVEFFEKHVRPVLAEYCYQCHSSRAKKLKGGLRLDSRAALLGGGDSGPALVPGQPEKSRLVEAISYKNADLQMPPRGKLPAAAVADLTTWVKQGAPWPAERSAKVPALPAEFDLQRRKHEHWAWQPIQRCVPPAVRDSCWTRCPSDCFILARLEAKGLSPAPRADRLTLLRRVYFDLIGLPPTPAAIEEFIHDPSPVAYESVVDRLLASPRFGERWARHWLDLVRYAETRGHEMDYLLPDAYQYRDYVIRALNSDVPYNQFVTEHIAGDLLEKPRLHPTAGYNESLLGTGFWFLGEEVHSPVDTRQDQADRFDNRIDVMTKTFFGLTVACARCHDHKFDAISQRDYYALMGFLESSSYRLARFESLEHNRLIAQRLWELRAASQRTLKRALAEALRTTVERLAEYLLTTRAPDAASRVDELARTRHLDPVLLRQWVTLLADAEKDKASPFHDWAITAHAGDSKKGVHFQPLPGAAGDALVGADVVVEYGKLRPEEWLPDGVAFGPGPVQPGDVRLGGEPSHPVLEVFDRAAAVQDSSWDGLKLATGSETDPGILGSMVRAGRTLRTPSIVLKTGKLYYLVRGTGRAYASVNAHALINGPLHAQLVRDFEAGKEFRWIEHDLSMYQGQRAHVEFTASSGFAVAKVVQAARMPGLPDVSICRPWQVNSAAESPALAQWAASYQGLFLATLDRLANDRPLTTDDARRVNWLLHQSAVFLPAGSEAAQRLAQIARPILDQQARLVAQIQIESHLALAMLDGNGVDERVFLRGSPRNLGAPAPRRFLEALAGSNPLLVHHGSGRLELARQITDPAIDPLLARVLANRIWHHLFGRGIVASVDNFGVLGERPTHPELLDYLAQRFITDGWSIKRLIRTLVMSSAYRMSSHPATKADQADPQNLLLHRMPLRRLEGEAIRDAMLMVSGRLNERMYGPSVPVHLTPFQDGRGRPPNGPLDGDGRRSLYMAVRRNFLSPMLLAFDTPTPFSTMGRRTVSNVPAQALILMNDPFVHQQAELWARRVLAQSGSTEERIRGMYLGAFGRPPTATDISACLAFLMTAPSCSPLPHSQELGPLSRTCGGGEGLGVRGSLLIREVSPLTPNPSPPKRGRGEPETAAWVDLAHVLFNVKEFIFLN